MGKEGILQRAVRLSTALRRVVTMRSLDHSTKVRWSCSVGIETTARKSLTLILAPIARPRGEWGLPLTLIPGPSSMGYRWGRERGLFRESQLLSGTPAAVAHYFLSRGDLIRFSPCRTGLPSEESRPPGCRQRGDAGAGEERGGGGYFVPVCGGSRRALTRTWIVVDEADRSPPGVSPSLQIGLVPRSKQATRITVSQRVYDPSTPVRGDERRAR